MARTRAFTAILLLALLLLPGCVVIPTKMPTKVRGTGGTELKPHAINVEQIEVGKTNRQQVKERFAAIDTHFEHPRLFWGRWVTSSFGIIAGVIYGFGPGEQADGSTRLWHTYDLFVTFDDDGVVASKKVLHDKDAIVWEEVRSWTKALHLPPCTETIIPQRAQYETSQMSFTPTEVQFAATSKRRETVMKYGPSLRVEIKQDYDSVVVAKPGTLCFNGRFSDEIARTVRKNHFCVGAPQLFSLIDRLDHSGTLVVLKK